MNSKKISIFAGTALVAMMIASGASYAANDVIKNPSASVTPNADMIEFAKQLGIDPTGKTNGELKQAIKENSLNIKTNPNAQDGKKQYDPQQYHLSLIELAQKSGINTDGLTDQQIEDAAIQLGIDPTGKTNGKLKQASKENGLNVKTNPNAQDGKKQYNPEQHHQSLIDLALQWGITTDGLTDEQIEDTLRAEKLNRVNQSK